LSAGKGFAAAPVKGGALTKELATESMPLRWALDQVPVGILFAEAPSGRIVYGNRQIETICQHPIIYSCDKSSHELWVSFHADGRQVQSEEYPLIRTLQTGERAELDVHYLRGDGMRNWVRISSAPLFDGSGTMIGAIVALIDIDGQRRNTEELRQARERLEAAINVAEMGIWTWHVGGPIIPDGNLATLLGLPQEQIAHGMPVDLYYSRVHPDDLARVQSARRKALVTGGAYTPEYRVFGLDGEVHWVAARGKAKLDAAGRPRSLNGAVLDITDRKRIEEALRESEERFRTLAAAVPQLIWTATPEGFIDYLSSQWSEFAHGDPAEFLGSHWDALLHPDDRAGSAEAWNRRSQRGEPYEMNQRLRHHTGEWRWVLTRARALRNSEGQIYKWVGTCTDVDEQLSIERDLRRANADLESFSFAAAHDLQEPLRMVTSYTQLLARRLEGQLDDESQELMGTVITGAKRISLLIQDLLAYTSVSRNTEQPKENVDLNRALQRALEHLASAIAATGATVSSEQLPSVMGYETHFLQLFQNLIGNSIKYRSAAAPQITIQAERRDERWIVSVEDNGVGIDPEYHKQIFGVFKRLHDHQIPGTGIGLAICQRVVERNGGEIWVESGGAGQGSTFCFSLPAAGA
jgi:PAS domain S-box-containing protein